MVSDFNKKKNREDFKNKVLFQAGGIFFVIVVIAFLIADFRIYQKKRVLIVQVELYKNQIEEIKKNNQTLKEEIENSDNKDYLEKVAYEQGMVKQGEKEIVFVMPQDKQAESGAKNSIWSSWLSGVWQWIKNQF